ncbi:uncharacterized protein LOC133175721 [Saccostrea echinata]|uniref:uncharacterized protein LOC133175721 n=1 Tax=Saccostrea echinata TaxID=191078 RepID=UPI002A830935|nr:uncharacterized protein LOC133175721 [Saccostrea echinata]
MYKPLELPPCKICDGEASGIHYGLNTCEACKAFFRRAVMEKDKYQCAKDKDCKIINRKRGNCSYCRLQKCLNLGMSRDAMRHGRYTVAIRTKTILEVKQLKQKAETINHIPVLGTPQLAIPYTNDSSIPKLDNLISIETTDSLNQGSDNSVLSMEIPNSISIQSISSQSTDTSTDFITSPTDFMTLSPPQLQMDCLADSDMTSLFEDLSTSYPQPQSQHTQIKLEDFADSLLDQPETSFDILEDLNVSLPDVCPEVEDKKEMQDSPALSPTRRSARIAEKRRSTLQEFKLDDDPWLSTIDPDFFAAAEDVVVPIAKKQRSSQSEFEMSVDEMEQMIWTLVWSQDQIYPEYINSFDKDYIKKLHNEYSEKYNMKNEFFGLKKLLSPEEFNSFYLATGIDVDGRMEMLKKAIEQIQQGIIKYISFARIIPGFEDLPTDDKLALIKASRFEYWLMGEHLHINTEMKVIYYPDTKAQLTRDDIIMIFGEPEAVDQCIEFAASLQKLKLTYEEVAVLKAIVITFRDREPLQCPEKVEAIQWKLVQCLKYLINKFHKGEPHRFSSYMDKLITMRKLTEINRKVNGRMESLHLSIMKRYPLVYECISHDARENQRDEENQKAQLEFIKETCTT